MRPIRASLQRDYFFANLVAFALSASFIEPVSDQIVFVPSGKSLAHLLAAERMKVGLNLVELNLMMAWGRTQLAPPRP
jgi:hypothetical protein